MKIVLIGTLKALETLNQIYNADVRVIDILEVKARYNRIIREEGR